MSSRKGTNSSSPKYLQPVLDSLDLHIAVLDADGTIVRTNRAWNRFREANSPLRSSSDGNGDERSPSAASDDQRTHSDAPCEYDIGVNYIELCERTRGEDAVYARQAAEGIRRVLRGELPVYHLEYPCHEARRKRWFQLTVQPLDGGEASSLSGAVVSHSNVTERILAEQHAFRLSAIVESTDDAVVGVDRQGRIISWNPSAERIYEYARDEAIGLDASVLSAEESTAEYLRIVEQAREGKVVGHRTARHRTRDGRHFDVSLTISPIRGAAGEIEGTSIIARDVSRHLQIQRDLRDSEQRFRGTFDNAKVGLALIDDAGRWMRVNPKVCELLQRSEDELLGQSLSQVTHPEDQEVARRRFEQLRAGEVESYSLEMRFLQSQQEVLFVDMTVAAQRATDPHDPEFYIAIIEDVSDRAATAAKVRRAEEAAKRLKSDFLANVSHEFRTPMNSILGMTRLALEEQLPEHVRDYLSTAQESAEGLLHLLDDILDFSKLESGRFTLEETGFDLGGAVEECVRQFEVEAEKKGIELRSKIDPNCPSHVVGDPFRLRQILSNLVSNAIKFTHAGYVEVAVDFPPDDESAVARGDEGGRGDLAEGDRRVDRLRFHVRDTGIGISPEKQQAIFEPFAQADTSTTRMFGGSGLGLAIATELIALMGGSMGLNSTPGAGSHFWFTARFRQSEMGSWSSERLRESARKALQGTRVLIADHDASYARVLHDVLEDWYVHAERVESGTALLQRLSKERLESGPLNVVLLDWDLPEIDVLRVTRQLQEDGVSGTIPIVLAGGRDSNRIARRCRGEEIRFLRKHPVSLADLLVLLREAAQASRQNQRQQRVAPDDSIHILIAEDTPANQKLTQTILERRGHTVALANNGRDAVNLVQEQAFDAILMDVQMPTVDGLQATTLIRSLEDPDRAATPIIALTAHAMRGDAQRCLDAGMDAYLAKPLDAAQLIELVESLARGRFESATAFAHDAHPPAPDLSASEGTAQGVAAMPTDVTSESHEGATSSDSPAARERGERSESPATDPPQIMDLSAALKRFANNRGLLAQMIGLFQEDAGPLLDNIRQGFAERNAVDTHRAAHSLKSLARSFDGEKTARLAESVEHAAHHEQWERVQQDLPRLETALAELLENLSQALSDDEPPPR